MGQTKEQKLHEIYSHQTDLEILQERKKITRENIEELKKQIKKSIKKLEDLEESKLPELERQISSVTSDLEFYKENLKNY